MDEQHQDEQPVISALTGDQPVVAQPQQHRSWLPPAVRGVDTRIPKDMMVGVPPAQNLRDVDNALGLDSQLSFPAHAVTVDNFNARWLYLPSAHRYIPPKTAGWVVRILSASEKASAKWAAPAPVVQPADDGGLATTGWTEEMLDPCVGVKY